MTKNELKARIAQETSIRKNVVSDVVDGVFALITEELSREGKVSISDFGIFTAADVNARTARNPATGDKIEIPAHKKVKFKASKVLNLKVNK